MAKPVKSPIPGMSDAEYDKLLLSHPVYAEGRKRRVAAEAAKVAAKPIKQPSAPKLEDLMKFRPNSPAANLITGTAREIDALAKDTGMAMSGVKKLLAGFPRLIDVLEMRK